MQYGEKQKAVCSAARSSSNSVSPVGRAGSGLGCAGSFRYRGGRRLLGGDMVGW